ncbi:NF038129 family PEP-CTERM protein [Pseudoduganella namucuonensis]|uniref:PEP-CTERM protein-sorting domain-containing protein/MYXO-CTERM domain-containing protein n=1 Tax=Pseudoduganella namucuonensis TaxID=1035707 RepID=A0A1I7LNB3_9BURK|nr:NF038129 family PEP-CTERM protein [Pseudoduganella namucuonensis]SFV11164.1 PEP-CTERM protein-sorting domain-containing protein/MYXO-CTERM domain-containing protein [Pseudoduganella namucuonensis]
MNHLKDLLARLMLAVFLMSGAGAASAGPLYSVSIDTSTLGSGPAYLGLYFLGLANAAPATATVSNLAGALAGAPSVTGTVGGSLPGALVFGNANGGGELVQGITLGGVFSFNLSFTLGAGDAGTTFGWALFNDTSYLGADGDLGTMSLQPGAAPDEMFLLSNASSLSDVQVVPEPSTLSLMLLAGLVMAVGARRRRNP